MKPALPAPAFLVVLLLGLTARPATAQIPVLPGPPQPASFPRYGSDYLSAPNPTPRMGHSYADQEQQRLNRQHEQMERERQQWTQQQRQARTSMDEDIRQIQAGQQKRDGDAQQQQMAYERAIQGFESAFTEIAAIVRGEKPMSTKRAVYLAENAYLQDQVSYGDFCKDIANRVAAIRRHLLPQSGELTPKMLRSALFRFLTDTTVVTGKDGQPLYTYYPIRYDFQDPMGQQNRGQLMVTKLLATNSGQCHSMPLYYKILAEELGVEAFIAYAPMHTYIMHPNQGGKWSHLELTVGSYITPQAILRSGAINAEALKSQIYLRPCTQRETMLQCLGNLAGYYEGLFGQGHRDEFVERCGDLSLSYQPHNLCALQIKHNVSLVRLARYAKSQGFERAPTPQEYQANPKLRTLHEEFQSWQTKLDAIGFVAWSDREYASWRRLLDDDQYREKTIQRMENVKAKSLAN